MSSVFYIFVEGSDDQRFFKSIVQSKLEEKYSATIKIIPYARTKKIEIIKLIESINNGEDDYYFICDIDDDLCIRERKQRNIRIFGEILAEEKIIVVIKEIESWYVAGLSDEKCAEYKIPSGDTNNLTKEDFDDLIPHHLDRYTFMMEILNNFCESTAKRKNISFDYFFQRIN